MTGKEHKGSKWLKIRKLVNWAKKKAKAHEEDFLDALVFAGIVGEIVTIIHEVGLAPRITRDQMRDMMLRLGIQVYNKLPDMKKYKDEEMIAWGIKYGKELKEYLEKIENANLSRGEQYYPFLACFALKPEVTMDMSDRFADEVLHQLGVVKECLKDFSKGLPILN